MFILKAKLKIIPGIALGIEISVFRSQFHDLIVFFNYKPFLNSNCDKVYKCQIFFEEFEAKKNLILKKSDTSRIEYIMKNSMFSLSEIDSQLK
jgi:hypothetical protein